MTAADPLRGLLAPGMVSLDPTVDLVVDGAELVHAADSYDPPSVGWLADARAELGHLDPAEWPWCPHCLRELVEAGLVVVAEEVLEWPA